MLKRPKCRARLGLLLSLLLPLAVACAPSENVSSGFEPFEIYTKVIIDGLGYTSADFDFLLREVTLRDAEMADIVPDLAALRPDLGLDETALADLMSRSSEDFHFDSPARFETPGPVLLADEADIPGVDSTEEDWERFFEAEGGATHVHLLSQIGVGDGQLVVYATSVCGLLCGGAYMFAFEAQAGDWALVTDERVADQ